MIQTQQVFWRPYGEPFDKNAFVGAGGFEPLSAQPLTDPNGQKKKAIDFAMAFL
jgi:hypothetical protein